MFQSWSAHDFETTTNEDNLGVRIWTITFRPSETYVKDGRKNSDLYRFFKDGLNNFVLLNPRIGVTKKGKDETIVIYGYRFEDYLSVCKSFKVSNGKKHWAFFHNLKNFDGYFILSGLKKAGYSVVDDWKGLLQWHPSKFYSRLKRLSEFYINTSKDSLKEALKWEIVLKRLIEKNGNVGEEIENFISKRWNKLFSDEYSYLLKNSQIYTIKISNLEWRDSALLFPGMSIKDMGNTLNKHFKFSDNSEYFTKGEDYEYLQNEFYPNLKALEDDKIALKYAIQDTFILWAFLMLMFDTWNKHEAPPKLTVASTAWNAWLTGFTNEKMLKMGYQWNKDKRKWIHPVKMISNMTFTGAKEFIKEGMFPWDADNNREWMAKGLYKGGLVGANEQYLGLTTDHVLHLDVTSMYPSISSSNSLLPYGCELKEPPKNSPYVMVGRMTATRDMKSGNNLPIAQIKSSEGFGRIGKKEVFKGESWYLTKPEADAFYRTYGPHWIFDDRTYFKALPAKEILGTFMEEWFQLKTQAKTDGNEALKNASKFPLNGLTGKWGSRVIVDSVLSTGEKFKQELTAYYTPLVSFITAYGRVMLSDLMLGKYHKVLYWDTDSAFIHWPKPFEKKEVEDYFKIKTSKGEVMHTWEVEHTNLTMLTLKAKGYMFQTKEGKKEVTLSGFHFNEEVANNMTFEKFISGFKHTQLQKKRFENGVILVDQVKEQIELWNYPHGRKVNPQECLKKARHYDKIKNNERG